MLQVHRDMICSKCNSVNEAERITRDEENTIGKTILMIIRCRVCRHEHVESNLTTWGDEGQEPFVFEITDWQSQTPESF